MDNFKIFETNQFLKDIEQDVSGLAKGCQEKYRKYSEGENKSK